MKEFNGEIIKPGKNKLVIDLTFDDLQKIHKNEHELYKIEEKNTMENFENVTTSIIVKDINGNFYDVDFWQKKLIRVEKKIKTVYVWEPVKEIFIPSKE